MLFLRKSTTSPITDLDEAINMAQNRKVATNPNNFFSFLTNESPKPKIAKKKIAKPKRAIPVFKLSTQDPRSGENLSLSQTCHKNK